jgi:Uncharacterised protein conserved in bacteria (DUF2336)
MLSSAMARYVTPPGLEGLTELDRKHVDIRPTLLRVLTDQYLHSAVHSADDVQHYTELAMRLFEETDIATRSAIAMRLAPHASAPRAVMLHLANDVIEVAEPVLLHSPCLTQADCAAISQERGREHARILSMRSGPAISSIAASPVAAPTTPEPVTQPTPIIVAAVNPPDQSEDQPTAADPTPSELYELFFAAGSPERRLILINLDYATWPPAPPPAPLQRADIWRVETAALRHHTATVTRELERALGISHRQASRIVEDEQGEPIVVAAKAMSLPADVLQRILLFMNPSVGQSVDRVYELSRLYGEISVDAARRLVAIMRAAEPAIRKPGIASTANTEAFRRPLSEHAGAKTKQPNIPVLRRAVGTND